MRPKSSLELDQMEHFVLSTARQRFGPDPKQRQALLGEVLAVAGVVLPGPELGSGVHPGAGLGHGSGVDLGLGIDAGGPVDGGSEVDWPSVPPPRSSVLRPKADVGSSAGTAGALVGDLGGGLGAGSTSSLTSAGGSAVAGAGAKAVAEVVRLKVLVGVLGGALVGLAVGSPGLGRLWATSTPGEVASGASPTKGAGRGQESTAQRDQPGAEAEPRSADARAPSAGEQGAPLGAAKPAGAEASSSGARASQSRNLSGVTLGRGPGARPEGAPSEPAALSAGATPFYQELTYLRRAQAALRRGEAAYALGLMESLEHSQKGGALRSERAVTQVLALCQLGRDVEAKAIARDLIARDSRSPYVARLMGSCAAISADEVTALTEAPLAQENVGRE